MPHPRAPYWPVRAGSPAQPEPVRVTEETAQETLAAQLRRGVDNYSGQDVVPPALQVAGGPPASEAPQAAMTLRPTAGVTAAASRSPVRGHGRAGDGQRSSAPERFTAKSSPSAAPSPVASTSPAAFSPRRLSSSRGTRSLGRPYATPSLLSGLKDSSRSATAKAALSVAHPPRLPPSTARSRVPPRAHFTSATRSGNCTSLWQFTASTPPPRPAACSDWRRAPHGRL